MAVLELTKEQVLDLVRQMPASDQREMLLGLARNSPAERARRQQFAEEQNRSLALTRSLNWNALTADDREAFMDDLVHEDRPCVP